MIGKMRSRAGRVECTESGGRGAVDSFGMSTRALERAPKKTARGGLTWRFAFLGKPVRPPSVRPVGFPCGSACATRRPPWRRGARNRGRPVTTTAHWF